MFPKGYIDAELEKRFPRARGDVPSILCGVTILLTFSPRTRGCSVPSHSLPGTRDVFPAHAGMFLPSRSPPRFPTGFPRARGDVPSRTFTASTLVGFSPRTRGCSAGPKKIARNLPVFPAHAGMFRRDWPCPNRPAGFPRARGDVPALSRPGAMTSGFSPRTRGCSGKTVPYYTLEDVFPAHAGMFLRFCHFRLALLSFPRARGDVPATQLLWQYRIRFSPRTRGCSCSGRHNQGPELVFPAHAGMFLSGCSS